MSLWIRTEKAGKVTVFYGTKKDRLDKQASLVTTDLAKDRTGIITLQKLTSNTRYYYRIADHQLDGSFRTLPKAADFRTLRATPRVSSTSSSSLPVETTRMATGIAGPTVPVFDTLNAKVRDEVHFAILNGDWLYEQRRDYPPESWLHQVGLDSMEEAPEW